MIRNLLRTGRRQLHTIVSRDVIRPSSPTPSHLKTYNLSLLDQIGPKGYMPLVTFYRNSDAFPTSDDKTRELKRSLSQTLTQYYPFAGKVNHAGQTHVDCNDEGVEFIEAFNDTPISDFLRDSEHEDLDQLFPDDLICYNSNRHNDDNKSISPLAVQVNHFACGGVAVAVSLFHKIADGSSLLNFVNHWATVARSSSSGLVDINPHFLRYQTRNVNLPKELHQRPKGDCITRSFMFPNSKINILKEKIIAMTTDSGQPITDPTRAEALIWLLHNRAVAAACKANSGSFNPTGICQMMNMRNNLVESLPETSIGNLYLVLDLPTTNEDELAPQTLISELRKRKTEFRGLKDVETVMGVVADTCNNVDLNEWLSRHDQYYCYSVMNRFPTYGIDFGWGKPIKVTLAGGVRNLIVLMDAPDGDGIEALVTLERRDMKIVQDDKELLDFCEFKSTSSVEQVVNM